MKNYEIKKAIVIPDLQIPFHDRESLRAVEKFMATESWDYVIYLGDFLDYFCISRFNEGKPGILEGKTIIDELAWGYEILRRQCEIVRRRNPKVKIYFIEGNHEARAYDFVMRWPHLKGIIEPEIVLKLKELKVKFIKSWTHGEVLNIGKANFAHGNYTNLHHAKKMVEAYEDNIFYGHTHDCNAFNKTSKGTGKTKVGQSMGCLCAYPKEYDYTHGWPSNWQQAFGVFYFRGDGLFNYNLIRIFNHKFIINGKIYA